MRTFAPTRTTSLARPIADPKSRMLSHRSAVTWCAPCAEDPPQSASEHPTRNVISLRPMCRTTSSTSLAGTGAGRRKSSSRRSSRKKQCAGTPQVLVQQARTHSPSAHHHHPTFESAAHKSRISEDTTSDDVSDSDSTKQRQARHSHLESLRSASTAAAAMTSSNRESNALRAAQDQSGTFFRVPPLPQDRLQSKKITVSHIKFFGRVFFHKNFRYTS